MKKIYKNTLFFLLTAMSTFGSWQLNAQIAFTNSNSLLQSSDWHSGVAIGVTDMNNDGLDDILRLEQGQMMTIEYQVPGQMFMPYTYASIDQESQWAMAAGDVNNDGYADVFGGDYNDSKIVLSNSDNTNYSHTTLPGIGFFSQGSNFVDINNDGFLDIFSCNDDGESGIWANNQDGTFSEANQWIDMTTTPVSDNSGNYGSIWTDFDNDGDLDLYIAKCRQGVGDPTDPRRINALFVNDGQNNFTEQAIDFGLKIGWQSWTSDFNDIDNDGDLDVFITNHDFANMVLENDGSGHYTDISTGKSIGIETTSLPIQGVMRDFDNDGFVDILVSGSTHHLYRNKGDQTFEEITGLFDNNQIESFALGDLNNDGFVDIYAGYANIYTNPSEIEDVIWMNDANDNNWFGVNLEGTISNRDAVGARVEIYGDWGVQVREVRSGESYGIMNSLKQNFGLGQATDIDYVVVKWPSGRINVIENPTINEYLDITEDGCEPFAVEIAADGNTIICEGETVNLLAPVGYEYIWSNGMTSVSIAVGNSGSYNAIVKDLTTNCYGISQNIQVQYAPDETPTIAADGDLEFCFGSSVMLTSSEAGSYEWSNGAVTQSIEVETPGDYYVTTQGVCSDNDSEMLSVSVLAADAPDVQDIDVVEGQGALVTLMATGDNPQWYDAEEGGNLLGEGNTLEVMDVTAPTTYWVENTYEYASPPEKEGMETHQGTDYSGPQWNAGLFFNAMSPFKLNSVLVYSDTEAERIISLRDQTGTEIASLLVNIPVTGDEGMRIDLNFDVPVGDGHILTTDEFQNGIALGTNSPRLKRADSGVSYNDYFIDGVLNITGPSIGGTTRYYYFFDWEIEEPSVFCTSKRAALNVDIVASTIGIDGSQEVQLFPNPTDGQMSLTLDFNQSTEVSLNVTDLAGKSVYTENIGMVNGAYNHELNLGHLSKGIYLIQVATPAHTYFGKIAIQ